MNLEGEAPFWFSGSQLRRELQETAKKKFMWTTENEAQKQSFLHLRLGRWRQPVEHEIPWHISRKRT